MCCIVHQSEVTLPVGGEPRRVRRWTVAVVVSEVTGSAAAVEVPGGSLKKYFRRIKLPKN